MSGSKRTRLSASINDGWTIAKYLLTHEREMIGGSGLARSGGVPVSKTAIEVLGSDNGILADTMLRTDIARFEMDERGLALTIERARDEVKAGCQSRRERIHVQVLRHRTEQTPLRVADVHLAARTRWIGRAAPITTVYCQSRGCAARANSIEGGTSEIHAEHHRQAYCLACRVEGR